MKIPNKFLKLDYNPNTDILFVEWPNMHNYTLPEVEHIIDEVVDTVRHYDVKRVLTDTRQSNVALSTAEYAGVINRLARELMTTRLQKFARLTTTDSNREKIASNAATLVQGVIQYKNFDDTDEAIAWLKS